MSADLVHVGYALMLCALVARDVLWLRAILSAAQFMLSLYGASQHLLGVAGWNALFVVINVAWVLRILLERRAVELPPALRELHARHFNAFTPGEFLRVWALGSDEELRDTVFLRGGERPASLYFLKSGEACVREGDRTIAQLRTGHFAGEMSLLTGEEASADVVASGALQVRRFPAEALRDLRRREPALWSKLQSVLGYDLIEKIRAKSGTAPD